MRCRCRDACGKHGDPLRSGRQLANDVDALHGTQLTDLLEADLKFSCRDHSAYRVGLDFSALALDLVGDPELRKQFGGEIDAAGAIGIRNRFCRQQRALQRVHGADVGLGRSGLDGHADQGLDQVDAAVRPDLALLDQIVQRGRGHDHDIDRLAAFEAYRNGVVRRSHGGAELGHKFVVRGAFVFGDQLQIGGREPPGSHDLDLVRAHRSDG